MKQILSGKLVIVILIVIYGIFACHALECQAWADDQADLFKAINSRDDSALEAVLSRGVSTELRSPNNCTALMFTAAINNPGAAKILIEHGADIEAKGFTSPDGDANSTTLILAAEMGSVGVAELLIEKGADVNYINSFNRTALFWAYKANKTEMIKLLESHGATKDGKAQDGSNSDNAAPAKTAKNSPQTPATPPKNSGGAGEENPIVAGFKNAADEARLRSCLANMKTLEAACELYMLDNGAPKNGIKMDELISKKILKAEPRCPVDKSIPYIIEITGNNTRIKCLVHNKTLDEMAATVAELKKAANPPGPNSGAATAPTSKPAPDAKKSAALKTFLEVFNKCMHNASVTIQGTSYQTKPPLKVTQSNYYRDPSNFRSDTQANGKKIKMVISSAGSWTLSENDGKFTVIPIDKAAGIISAMDIGSLVSNNIASFEVIESKDKNNNVLIYLTNKSTGFMNTYVIDPKLMVIKRLCVYPKKGVLAEDNIYGAWKFGALDDKVFAAPAAKKSEASKTPVSAKPAVQSAQAPPPQDDGWKKVSSEGFSISFPAEPELKNGEDFCDYSYVSESKTEFIFTTHSYSDRTFNDDAATWDLLEHRVKANDTNHILKDKKKISTAKLLGYECRLEASPNCQQFFYLYFEKNSSRTVTIRAFTTTYQDDEDNIKKFLASFDGVSK